nr:glycosyl hydrolase [Micromonospora sp. DSM 115978]
MANDRENWVPCFRQVVTSIRTTAPEVRIDWTYNAHTPDAFEYYPGDEYVDIIGVDTYDQWPPRRDEATWNRLCNEPPGLWTGIAFAREHGKQFSVPEWGLVATHDTGAGRIGQAGGDNPFYIQKMFETFRDNADILAYEAYFNDDNPGNVHSSLINPSTHPLGAA